MSLSRRGFFGLVGSGSQASGLAALIASRGHEAAMAQAGVTAAESMMVGDSISHDIEGARRVGMRGVLVHRAAGRAEVGRGITVVRDLSELLDLI